MGKIHGMHGSTEHTSWRAMRNRCRNKSFHAYKHYTEKGIKCCAYWGKFENFLKDMGFKPSAEYQLDRINNNKGYCKQNCRWATKKEQMLNTSVCNSHLIDGRLISESQLSLDLGGKNTLIALRKRRGWDIKKSISMKKIDNLIEFNGIKRTGQGWSKFLGFSKDTIGSRLRKGWSIEKALSTPIRKA